MRQETCRDCDNIVTTACPVHGVTLCKACKERIRKAKDAEQQVIRKAAAISRPRKAREPRIYEDNNLIPSDVEDRWCETCGHIIECQSILWTGEPLLCQPQGVKVTVNVREIGDLVSRFVGGVGARVRA